VTIEVNGNPETDRFVVLEPGFEPRVAKREIDQPRFVDVGEVRQHDAAARTPRNRSARFSSPGSQAFVSLGFGSRALAASDLEPRFDAGVEIEHGSLEVDPWAHRSPGRQGLDYAQPARAAPDGAEARRNTADPVEAVARSA